MWEEGKVPSIIVMSEEEYHNLGHCSYSFLSTLDKMGYRAFSAKKKVGKAMNLGSFIDCYILTPELLEENFAQIVREPTASKKVLADFIIENYNDVPSKGGLQEISKELGLWSTRRIEKVIELFDDEFIEYMNKSIENKGKSLYSLEDLELADICKQALFDSHLSEHIFRPEEFGTEVLFQTKGIFKLDDVHIKFMVDIIVIDRKLKKIYPYDLKTGMEDLDSFETSFLKYRYDIQYYLYIEGINAIREDLNCKNYDVEPLRFLYLSKLSPNIPVIYKVPKDIDIYNGYTTKFGYKMTGIKQLLNDFLFYSGGYTVPRRVAEGNGVVILDI